MAIIRPRFPVSALGRFSDRRFELFRGLQMWLAVEGQLNELECATWLAEFHKYLCQRKRCHSLSIQRSRRSKWNGCLLMAI
jgi:hypothetical protein